MSAPIRVTLMAENRDSSEGTARSTPFGAQARAVKALGFALAGLLGAALFLPVIGVHLFTTWALPLLGFYAAYSAWKTVNRVDQVQGPCPACGAQRSWEGSRDLSPYWADCGACHRNIRVTPKRDGPA